MASIPSLQLEQAHELVQHAEKYLIFSPSTSPKDKVLHLLNNLKDTFSKYENFERKLKALEYEIKVTSFPYNLELEKELILDLLSETSSRVIEVLKNLQDYNNPQISPRVLAELEVPIFNGTILPHTWPEWIIIFNEFLQQLDLDFSTLDISTLKKAFINEPLAILDLMSANTSATTAISNLEKIYGDESLIRKSIYQAIKTIRIPHYKRQQWERMEVQCQKLQTILRKIPSGKLSEEFTDAIETCLPLEKRETYLFALKVRPQEEYYSFTLEMLEEIENFASYSTKRFLQATMTGCDTEEESCSDSENDDSNTVDLEDEKQQSMEEEDKDYSAWLAASNLEDERRKEEARANYIFTIVE